MKKLICLLAVLLAVGCGDERGKNGEKQDPLVRFYYDFDFDSLPENCVKYHDSNPLFPLTKGNVKSDELFVSDTFVIEPTELLPRFREEAEKEDVIIVINRFSGMVVFGEVSDSYTQSKFVLREHKDEAVIEVETIVMDKGDLSCPSGFGCSGRVPFKSFDPIDSKTYSISAESDGDFELRVSYILSGAGIEPECL